MLLMSKVFSRPERRSVYKRRVLAEMETLGLNSIGIVIDTGIGEVCLLVDYQLYGPPWIN